MTNILLGIIIGMLASLFLYLGSRKAQPFIQQVKNRSGTIFRKDAKILEPDNFIKHGKEE